MRAKLFCELFRLSRTNLLVFIGNVIMCSLIAALENYICPFNYFSAIAEM